eukprot:7765687-Heterocapsa_arctica.AAC.1
MDVARFKTDHNVVYAKVTVQMRDRKRNERKGRRRKTIDYTAEEIDKATVLLHERLPNGANYKTIMETSHS